MSAKAAKTAKTPFEAHGRKRTAALYKELRELYGHGRKAPAMAVFVMNWARTSGCSHEPEKVLGALVWCAASDLILYVDTSKKGFVPGIVACPFCRIDHSVIEDRDFVPNDRGPERDRVRMSLTSGYRTLLGKDHRELTPVHHDGVESRPDLTMGNPRMVRWNHSRAWRASLEAIYGYVPKWAGKPRREPAPAVEIPKEIQAQGDDAMRAYAHEKTKEWRRKRALKEVRP